MRVFPWAKHSSIAGAHPSRVCILISSNLNFYDRYFRSVDGLRRGVSVLLEEPTAGRWAHEFCRAVAGAWADATLLGRPLLSLCISGDFGGAARAGCGRSVCLLAARMAGALDGEPARNCAVLGECFANLVVLEIVLHTSVSLSLDWPNFWRLTLLYLVAALPFFVTGLLFSVVFARHANRITQLYGADLLGGSIACLALVPLLNFVGGPNAILFAAVAVALAGVAWSLPGKRMDSSRTRRPAADFDRRQLSRPRDRHCLCERQKREQPLFARWNALSRVEVDQQGTAKVIVIDADASTYLDEHRSPSLAGGLPAQLDVGRRRRWPTCFVRMATSPSSDRAAAWTCCEPSPMAVPT